MRRKCRDQKKRNMRWILTLNIWIMKTISQMRESVEKRMFLVIKEEVPLDAIEDVEIDLDRQKEMRDMTANWVNGNDIYGNENDDEFEEDMDALVETGLVDQDTQATESKAKPEEVEKGKEKGKKKKKKKKKEIEAKKVAAEAAAAAEAKANAERAATKLEDDSKDALLGREDGTYFEGEDEGEGDTLYGNSDEGDEDIDIDTGIHVE